MTVAAKPPLALYSEDGQSISFPVPFRFKAPADLVVERLYPGGMQLLTLGADYTVTGGATDAGGTLTRTFATSGAVLRIRRQTPRTQPMDYATGDRFPAESHEEALDRGTLIDQEQDVAQADVESRAIRVPVGEAVTALPPAVGRLGRILGFDPMTGAPIMVPGSAAQLAADLAGIIARLLMLEIGGSLTPAGAAAIGMTWASMQNVARVVRERAFTDIPIKGFGIGSSRMKNEDGSLAGVGNSPIEVALRQAKAKLDPFGFCKWECANGGVNGSAWSGYDVAGLDQNPDPRSPRVKLIEYKPDFVVADYQTNDSAPESYNTGQTRDYIRTGVEKVANDCRAIDCDFIVMTGPSAHVGKSVPVRLNVTVPMNVPVKTFQIGQSPFTESFTFTAGNNRITATRPVFNDAAKWGEYLAVDKAAYITDANLGSGIPNTGIYNISAIDPAGMWLEVNRKLADDGTGYKLVDAGPAAFVNAGPVNAAIKRVGIDSATELVPNMANGDKLIEPLGDGRKVRVLTRYYDINQLTREAVAVLDMPIALVDEEALYDLRRIQYGVRNTLTGEYTGGENRYYAPQERVHTNDVYVADVTEPAFMSFFGSLASVLKAISNPGHPRYHRSIVGRPHAGPSDPWSLLDPNSVRRPAFDIELDEKNGAIRNAAGAIVMELVGVAGTNAGNAQGYIKRRIRGTGGYQPTYPLSAYEFNRGTSTPLTVTMPSAGLLRGIVQGQHNGQADVIYGIKAYWDGVTWSVTASKDHYKPVNPAADPLDTLTFAGAGATFSMTPTAANGCYIFHDLQFIATVATAPATLDA